MRRRAFTGWLLNGSVLLISGCLSRGGSSPRTTRTCRQVTRERTETLYTDRDSWSAGESYTWSVQLDARESLQIEAVTVDGARPAVEITDPDGEVVLDVGPATKIERTYTTPSTGTYYVTFTNEAMVSSGQWDIQITATFQSEEQRCR